MRVHGLPGPMADRRPGPSSSGGGGSAQAALAGLAVLLAVAGVAAAAAAVAVPPRLSLAFLDGTLGVDAFRDEGVCEVWRRNASDPGNPDEDRFRCAFALEFEEHRDGTTLVHQVLRNLDRDRVVRVPGTDPPRLEEWFPVVSSMRGDDAWSYAYEGAREEGAGVFTPPPGARGNVTVGWVTSNGSRDGEPRLQVARTYREEGVETVEGVEAVRWSSFFHRQRVVWHGQEQLRTEEAETWTDPRNGFTLRKDRTTIVEMTPAQLAANEDLPAPPGAEGGEPVKVAEVSYRTTAASTAEHADQIRSYERLMGLVGDGVWIGVALGVGAAVAGGAAVVRARR